MTSAFGNSTQMRLTSKPGNSWNVRSDEVDEWGRRVVACRRGSLDIRFVAGQREGRSIWFCYENLRLFFMTVASPPQRTEAEAAARAAMPELRRLGPDYEIHILRSSDDEPTLLAGGAATGGQVLSPDSPSTPPASGPRR